MKKKKENRRREELRNLLPCSKMLACTGLVSILQIPTPLTKKCVLGPGGAAKDVWLLAPVLGSALCAPTPDHYSLTLRLFAQEERISPILAQSASLACALTM